MSKAPKMTAALRKERIAGVSSKRDDAISINSERDTKPTASPVEPAKAAAPKTLPKVTLYAHAEVLRAIRLVAVEDGVQAQEILRAAVRDYLATRGHVFTDLTTGR